MSKKMPLDRYPYMENDLKSIDNDISILENRVSKIENDIYGEPIILHFGSENISDLIKINDEFALYGKIIEADLCITGKNISLKIDIKFNDYNTWVNTKGFENSESPNYKQYFFNIGKLKKYKPMIFTGGSSSRYSSQITSKGDISARFVTPFYKQTSSNIGTIGYHYISKDF